MMEDLKRYFVDEDHLCTNQQKIGMKKLFHRIIVKEWVDNNQNAIDYLECNKEIVKLCVHFYHECQKTRCAESHKEGNQLELLGEQVKRMKESEITERVEGMHEHMSKYEIEEDEAMCSDLRNQIKGCRIFMRNAPTRVASMLNDWIEK